MALSRTALRVATAAQRPVAHRRRRPSRWRSGIGMDGPATASFMLCCSEPLAVPPEPRRARDDLGESPTRGREHNTVSPADRRLEAGQRVSMGSRRCGPHP